MEIFFDDEAEALNEHPPLSSSRNDIGQMALPLFQRPRSILLNRLLQSDCNPSVQVLLLSKSGGDPTALQPKAITDQNVPKCQNPMFPVLRIVTTFGLVTVPES
jgi:hypothetical protein